MHACEEHQCTVLKAVQRQMQSYLSVSNKNLPTPGIGEPGVLGIPPDLSGGPPGAERGTRSVGRTTADDLTTC